MIEGTRGAICLPEVAWLGNPINSINPSGAGPGPGWIVCIDLID